jgi:acylphosphatase
VVVHGVVQGVGFRVSCAQRARDRRVAGWVRNRSDGTVEAVLEGDDDAVASLVEWCARGPRGAEVSSVDVTVEEPEGSTSFEIR